MLAHCRSLMRDLGAPAVLVEGQLLDTPFGPRMVATLGLPSEMGAVPLSDHQAYRRAMRDAAGLVSFVRMAALGAADIDPITASREPEAVLWQVVVLPAGVVLITRTEDADFGPFLLTDGESTVRLAALVAIQLDFAGITVGNAMPHW